MKTLLILLVVVLAGYLIYNLNQGTETLSVPSSDIQPVGRQLDGLISKEPVDSGKLASLVAKNPKLAAVELRNYTLSLSGRIHSMKIVDTEKMVLRVALDSPAPVNVCLTFDARRYNTTQTFSGGEGRFEIVGGDAIFYPTKNKKRSILFRIGDTITRTAAFDRVEASEAHFTVQGSVLTPR